MTMRNNTELSSSNSKPDGQRGSWKTRGDERLDLCTTELAEKDIIDCDSDCDSDDDDCEWVDGKRDKKLNSKLGAFLSQDVKRFFVIE